MNGDTRRPGPPDPEPPDAGEPIAELSDYPHPASRSFLGRVRSRLQRRMFGSHVATFAWHGVASVFMEFLKVFFGLFDPPGRPKGDSR